jgi:hypothetical protein
MESSKVKPIGRMEKRTDSKVFGLSLVKRNMEILDG